MLKREGKTAVFIDGSNLYATAKALHFNMDYKALREDLHQQLTILRLHYYTAIFREQDGTEKIRGLVDFLRFNGYTVITKPAKEYVDERTGDRKIKGNMDMEMAVDAMRIAQHVDHIMLFTGDGDFRYLVENIQQQGVRVTVVSSQETKNSLRQRAPMIADDLRSQCDNFLELNLFRDIWGEKPARLVER